MTLINMTTQFSRSADLDGTHHGKLSSIAAILLTEL
jgi:hypothetical protein